MDTQASTQVPHNATPQTTYLAAVRSGKFLALHPDCQGGLILQTGQQVEFVCAGAAIGGYFDRAVTQIYTIGEVMFYAPGTRNEWEQAFQKRAATIKRLQDIATEPSPLRRAELVLRQLSRWAGAKALRQIPLDSIGEMAKVAPAMVVEAFRKSIATYQPAVDSCAIAS
ncbi:MAG: hypothetical protein HC925_00480 [Coleofasciculaceae cyanobacterium SM2_3_26]|nr:hypothetical protein [Coleofasciculaceae cyanobacterium SM2_3_26]